jgi:hypothetical protein
MAAIRSFVKIKPFAAKTAIGTNFNELRKGINRTGVLVEGIGQHLEQSRKLVEFEREFLRSNTQATVTRIEDETKSKETFAKRMQRFYGKLFEKKKRQKSEDAAEKGDKEAQKDKKKFADKIKKPVKGFLQALGGILGTVAKYFIIFGVLNWLEKNPESAVKLFKLIYHIGKFAYNIASFGINGVMNGLTNMFGDFSADGINENIVKRGFRFLLGAFQLLGGVAALKAAQYVMMPWKLMQDINFVRGIFSRQAAMEAESEVAREKRKTGYRDKKTGVIYTKEEVEQMRKSAQRADAKRGKKAGKGMKSSLYQDELNQRLQGQYGGRGKGPLGKLQQRGRIAGKKLNKGFKNFAKANPGKISGAFSILGGATRIAGGLAAGESAGKAVGAGVGQAAGGVLGAAAGTALLGPFLGPFAPMVGSAIGSFLGEWVGSELGPILEPIFGPIKRYFGMMFKVVSGVFGEVFQPIKELFSALFDFVGQLANVLMEVAGILKDFADFIFGGIMDTIGKTVQFVINNAKRLMDPMSVAKGYADMLTFNLFDFDGYNKRAAGGPVGFAAGGVFMTRTEKKRQDVLDILTDTGDNGFIGVLKTIVDFVSGLTGGKKAQPSGSSPGGGSTSGTTGPSGPGYSGDPGDIAASGSVVQKGVEISKKIMTDGGATKEAAAAIAGNMAHESAGFIPGIREGGPFGRNSKPWPKGTVRKGYGWAQWTNSSPGDRYDKFIESYGGDYNKVPSNADNYRFLMKELLSGNGGFISKGAGTSGSWSEFKQKTDLNNATVDFRKTWERAGVAHDESRINYAKQFYQQLASGGKVKRITQVGLGEPTIEYYKDLENKALEKKSIQGFAMGGLLATNGSVPDVRLTPDTPFSKYPLHHNKPDSHSYNNNRLGGPPIVPRDYVAVRDFGNQSKDRGTPVVAGVDGKVVYASGHTVVIAKNGKDRMQFHHFDKIKASVGQMVDAKTVIGLQGNKPSGAVHVHLDANPSDHRSFAANQLGATYDPKTMKESGSTASPSTSSGGDTGSDTGGEPEKPLTLDQQVEQLFKSFEGDFRKAFALAMGSTELDTSKSFGLRTIKGEALESATKQKAMISQSEISGTKVKQFVDLQNKVRKKAQRDKDRKNVMVPPTVVTNTIQQPLINNRGGQAPNIVWTKPSPLLTNNK